MLEYIRYLIYFFTLFDKSLFAPWRKAGENVFNTPGHNEGGC